MTDVIIARALHVLGVVIWIGGVWMVTAVVLPGLRRPADFVSLSSIEASSNDGASSSATAKMRSR
jgi:uncharacterized membrane protein